MHENSNKSHAGVQSGARGINFGLSLGGSRRGQGSGPPPPPPLKNHENIGFLCNSGPDPLKIHKATKPAFNEGPSFKWRFAGGPTMARF